MWLNGTCGEIRTGEHSSYEDCQKQGAALSLLLFNRSPVFCTSEVVNTEGGGGTSASGLRFSEQKYEQGTELQITALLIEFGTRNTKKYAVSVQKVFNFRILLL
jgi:hypothetical protein